MSFATGLITGLAKSVDDQLKNDMLRTQKRVDGMEQYRVTRKRADIERKQKEDREIAEIIEKFAASYTNGDLDQAEQLYVGAGANIKDANNYYDILKKNEAVTKDFNINDHVTFSERVRSKDVTAAEIADNYSEGVRTYKDKESVKAVGLMNLFDKGKFGRQIDKNVESQVPTPESNYGKIKRKGAKFNHSNFIAFKEFEKNNRRDLGPNFEAEFIILNNEIMFAEGEEKEKLIKQRDMMDAKIIEKARLKKTGTGITSIFSKEGITKVIDSTIKGAVSNEYTETVGDAIKILTNGNEGPVFEQKNNGIKALEKKYSSISKASEPVLWNAIAAEKQLQRQERNTYIGKEYQKHLSVEEGSTYEKYQTADSTAQQLPATNLTEPNAKFEFEKKALKRIAIENSYPPGKVIEYKAPNGNLLKLIWTGQNLLQ